MDTEIQQENADAVEEDTYLEEEDRSEDDWLDDIDAALDDAAGVRSLAAETQDAARVAALLAEARSLDEMAAYGERKLAELRAGLVDRRGDADEY